MSADFFRLVVIPKLSYILPLFLLVLLMWRIRFKRALHSWIQFGMLSDHPFVLLTKQHKVLYANEAFKRKILLSSHVDCRGPFQDLDVISSSLKDTMLAALGTLDQQHKVATAYVEVAAQQKMKLKALMIPSPAMHVLIVEELSQMQLNMVSHKDFIANASHELRTPITIIKGFVETLVDLPEVSEVMLEDIFEKILRSCKRMEATIKNLMILIDLDHPSETRVKPFDVVTLCDSCFHTLKTLHPKMKCTITCDQEELIFPADGDLLELALMNLMQNAVKYSASAADILVECKEEKGSLVIAVSDRGIGIPLDKQGRIFDRFFTVDKALSKKLGGTGLGLSIVKSIIEKHQGDIYASSRDGGGTTFTITLPRLS